MYMAIQDEECNFLLGELEKNLKLAAQSDELRYRQNDAKLRAVNQNVETYEEFREIVNAAHLKPLDKSDKIQQRPKTIWNTFATKRKKVAEGMITTTTSVPDNLMLAKHGPPGNNCEFLKLWRKIGTTDDDSRYRLLKSIDQNCLAKVLTSEANFGLLGDVVSCLAQHDDTVTDFAFVVHTLEILSRMRRFGLALQFLGTEEARQCRALFQGLRNDMCDKLQDLAEMGITEWTLQQLERKYEANHS